MYEAISLRSEVFCAYDSSGPWKLHFGKIGRTLKQKLYPKPKPTQPKQIQTSNKKKKPNNPKPTKTKMELFLVSFFVWNAVFVVAKTWKYSTYRYGTSYIRNFDISAYREVHTCVT